MSKEIALFIIALILLLCIIAGFIASIAGIAKAFKQQKYGKAIWFMFLCIFIGYLILSILNNI